MLYGSFFTLNAENLFRGHRIPASPRRPQLILAALGIDKAFGGAQRAADVLPLSSLYFPPASLLGLVRPVAAALLEMSGSPEQTHVSEQGRRVGPHAVIRDGITRTSRKTRLYGVVIVFLSTIMAITRPAPPFCSPHGALNRLHFTNGKLSSRRGSGVYKYVKYTFNYFK